MKKEIKIKLDNIPYIETEKEEIDDIDDWIKSLKIFKLRNGHLSNEYFKTSYEVYQNISSN